MPTPLKRRRAPSLPPDLATTSTIDPTVERLTFSPETGAHAAKKLKHLADYTSASPYPAFTRPTLEETRAVYTLLSAHTPGGAPVYEAQKSDASSGTNAATCSVGLPDVLDALIDTILSQNTSAANSTRAKRSLDAMFGRGESAFDQMANADLGKLAKAIECGGLANRKAKTIQTLLKGVKEKRGRYTLQHLHQSDVTDDDATRELVSYKGVGPKTAACVLSFCLGRQAFAVDTHVFRLVKMLGWVPERADRVGAQAHLELKIPPELKFGLHVMMVKHGRTCKGCRSGGKGSCPLKAWLREWGSSHRSGRSDSVEASGAIPVQDTAN
ncbi:hypothetical protein ID866_5254 [Astraeus odoratus]|nr:hypothetical protein ID866_5254 [Astraeus odoratus]